MLIFSASFDARRWTANLQGSKWTSTTVDVYFGPPKRKPGKAWMSLDEYAGLGQLFKLRDGDALDAAVAAAESGSGVSTEAENAMAD